MYRSIIITSFLLAFHYTNAQYWLPVNGQIPGAQYTGVIANSSSSALVASTLNNGIYRSTDTGNTWQQVSGIQDSIFSLASLDGKHLCAGGKGFSLTSSDSGLTWTIHPFPFHIALSRLEFHPTGALLAGTGSKWDLNAPGGKGVWLSADTGKTWSPLNTGITKPDPLIEALAISTDGTILAGIYDGDVGLNGKYGIMKLDSLNGSWQRVNITVSAPFNQTFLDQNLRVESVFNINIVDQQVVSSISGVYINFGYAFTMQKSIHDIGNDSILWQLKWVVDSFPSLGSYYEHIVNIFQDSNDSLWASVSDPGNEINNNIYSGPLSAPVSWMMNMDSISQQTGRFLFAESANKLLYSAAYFTGNEIFVRMISGTAGVNEKQDYEYGWNLFPNPATSAIFVAKPKDAMGENAELKLYDMMGNKLFEKKFTGSDELFLELDGIPYGAIYILSIATENHFQRIPFSKL